MLKALIVADDLTGANDTGALLRKAGFTVVASPFSRIASHYYEGKDVLSINTDSRALSPEDAYGVVKDVIHTYAKSGMLVSKRIDSTLRGNVGSEIDGALDALPPGYKAVVVASSPAAGRICVGGYVLVHGIPLELSDSATDKKTPVKLSQVVNIIQKQSSREIELIGLCDVLKGKEHLQRVIRNSKASVLVFDATSELDIGQIAEACIASENPFVCVDPGAFTLAVVRQRDDVKSKSMKLSKNLLVIGSLSQASHNQLDYFLAKHKTLVYCVDLHRLAEDPEGEKARAQEIFSRSAKEYQQLCITTMYSKRDFSNSDCQDALLQAQAISSHLASMAEYVVKQFPINAVYLCGGDIAKEFLNVVGAQGLDIIEEVIPLAVHGRILGGICAGLPILTKGGMIGDEEAIEYMFERVFAGSLSGISV